MPKEITIGARINAFVTKSARIFFVRRLITQINASIFGHGSSGRVGGGRAHDSNKIFLLNGVAAYEDLLLSLRPAPVLQRRTMLLLLRRTMLMPQCVFHGVEAFVACFVCIVNVIVNEPQ